MALPWILLFGLALICRLANAQPDAVARRIEAVCSSKTDSAMAAQDYQHRDFAAARDILSHQKPVDTQARAELLAVQGVLDFLGGNMGTAISAFDRAAALAPLRTEDQFTLAMACIQTRSNARASELLLTLSKEVPTQAVYPYWLGRLEYDSHRYEEAVGQYWQALARDRKFVRAWNGLGLAFDMQGQTNEAENALTRATYLNRDAVKPSPWPPHDLGVLLLRIEKLTAAEDRLREALRYDGQLAQAHYHLARVLEKENKLDEAVGQYSMAMRDDTGEADACYSLATLYRKLGKTSEAEAMFAEYRRRREQGASR